MDAHDTASTVVNRSSSQALLMNERVQSTAVNDATRKRRGTLIGSALGYDFDSDPFKGKPKTRFLDRDAPYMQSKGQLNVQRLNQPLALRVKDLVHSLMHINAYNQILIFTAVYVLTFIGFAPFFWWLNDQCGFKMAKFQDAMLLSLETQLTIGYGVPDIYLNHCWEGTVLILTQSVVSIMVDAMIIGLFFARISRPSLRAQSIVFSDKALLQEIRGHVYFTFQVCELRKHQLVEAHVRCYGVRHQPSFSYGAMRLQRPDDQLGSMVLLALPTTVVHRIDPWSPLAPHVNPLDQDADREMVEDEEEQARQLSREAKHNPAKYYMYPDVPQRSCDVESGDRGTVEQQPDDVHVVDRVVIEDYLAASQTEVLVILEGIDSFTGCSVQARHSYTAAEMEWDAHFAPCVFSDEDGGCCVDFSKFHDTIPLRGHSLQWHTRIASHA